MPRLSCAHIPRRSFWRLSAIGVVAALAACSSVRDASQSAREWRADLTPTEPWSAPGVGKPAPSVSTNTRAAHGGSAASISQWWQHFDDPLLAALIDDAQATSPTVGAALSRMREARASVQLEGASLLPSVSLGVSGSRGVSPGTSVPATQGTAGFQSQWELDLFGGLRHREAAANARAEQSRMEWHDARVSLAADVAQTYLNLRSCEAVEAVLAQSADSQRKSAELTRDKARVGFEAPANAALAQASAADASNRLVAQRVECGASVLALSTLTGRSMTALNQSLASRRAALPQPGQTFDVERVPAEVLASRPDVAAAEQALAATESDVQSAQAARWPRLVFGGSIGTGLVRVGGVQTDGLTWSFLPSLSWPLLDGGRVAAGIDAAQARRDAAVAQLDGRIRAAVREIEEALMRLDAARTRETDALTAAEGFQQYFVAVEQRWRLGAASVIELEEARRLKLNAQAALIGLQRERVSSWIALYRATGGGWRPDDGDASLPAPRERRRR